ncbi:hypothetical protein [Brevibacterium aurantiacum]|uniref:Uncharacterized protein n=1 Tax=Brevibacterium aurantiacum TaxID=273384 RepID=A0A2A3YZR1_BREAU|nr:hypothetical protein [Brevibacterium aurantiacum]PCC44749.1 hypothetical protein CIK65_00880 [Brevibacterium aurantiacum]
MGTLGRGACRAYSSLRVTSFESQETVLSFEVCDLDVQFGVLGANSGIVCLFSVDVFAEFGAAFGTEFAV